MKKEKEKESEYRYQILHSRYLYKGKKNCYPLELYTVVSLLGDQLVTQSIIYFHLNGRESKYFESFGEGIT